MTREDCLYGVFLAKGGGGGVPPGTAAPGYDPATARLRGFPAQGEGPYFPRDWSTRAIPSSTSFCTLLVFRVRDDEELPRDRRVDGDDGVLGGDRYRRSERCGGRGMFPFRRKYRMSETDDVVTRSNPHAASHHSYDIN